MDIFDKLKKQLKKDEEEETSLIDKIREGLKQTPSFVSEETPYIDPQPDPLLVQQTRDSGMQNVQAMKELSQEPMMTGIKPITGFDEILQRKEESPFGTDLVASRQTDIDQWLLANQRQREEEERLRIQKEEEERRKQEAEKKGLGGKLLSLPFTVIPEIASDVAFTAGDVASAIPFIGDPLGKGLTSLGKTLQQSEQEQAAFSSGLVKSTPLVGGLLMPDVTQESITELSKRDPIKIGKFEIGQAETGEIVGNIGWTVAQYGAVSNAIDKLAKGSKLAALLNKSKLGKFAVKQGADLFADVIVQSPNEVARAIKEDKTLNEFEKEWLNARKWDLLINLAIGGSGEAINALKQSKADKALIKARLDSITDITPAQKQVVENIIDTKSVITPGVEATRKAVVDPLTNVTKPISELQPEEQIKTVDNIFNRVKGEQTIASPIDDQFKETIRPAVEDTISGQGKTLERGFSENIRTDESMARELRNAFDENPEFYNQLRNTDVLELAQKRFDKGYEAALKDFDASKNQLRPDNVVLSRLLANEAIAQGDVNTARRIIADMAETLTTAGQFSQAARILRESNDPGAILQYIEGELGKLNKQGIKKFGKKWNVVRLTDDEVKLIGSMGENLTDVQKQEVFNQIYDRISQRIPVSKMEKFDAWRRIAMLANPKTHVRNIVGNSIMAGTKKVADTIGAGLEKFIPKSARTKSLIAKPEYRQLAQNYWDANKDVLKEGSRWEIFGLKSPFAEKKIFDSKLLQSINDVSMNALEIPDIYFLRKHFVRDLAGFMQSRGLKEPTQEAVNYALRRAQEATFREANSLAKALNTMKSKGGFGKLVEAAIPFTKTPANILKTGLDYSPVGAVKSIFSLLGNAPPAKAVEEFSKGLTGSGLALLGFYLAKNDLVRGDYKKDASEESLLRKMGVLPNSIVFPNGSYTIDWAQPAAIPFFMGVNFQESLENQERQLKDGEELDLSQAALEAFITSGDTLVKQSMLQGIEELFGGYGSTTEGILSLPAKYIEQGIPTLLGQTARTVDPTVRMKDYSSILDAFKTRSQAKTPGLSQQLPAKFDLLGDKQTYGEGFGNFIQQFVSPGYTGTQTDDVLTQELFRLYNEVGSDFLPRVNVKRFSYDGTKYDLTIEEQSLMQQLMGEQTRESIAKIINTSSYRNADDKQKAKIIKSINDNAYETAKLEIVRRRNE